MLGDLKDKLEPIGRLDALDGVGSRVLAYYQKEGTSDLTDAALSQRSRALSLMAEWRCARRHRLALFVFIAKRWRERRKRSDGVPTIRSALFDHAQNVFYVGEIAHNRGDYRTAENSCASISGSAVQMIALRPDSMKWRMEEQYADFNLGVVLWDQRKFPAAAAQFRRALATIEAISTADPQNRDYRREVAKSLAWLGDAEQAVGNYPQAIEARRRGIAVLEPLFAKNRDVNDQMRLIPAHRALGKLYSELDSGDLAIDQLKVAVTRPPPFSPRSPTTRSGPNMRSTRSSPLHASFSCPEEVTTQRRRPAAHATRPTAG